MILVLATVLLLHAESFGQDKKGRMPSRSTLLSDKVINSINVGENIDLVLIQGKGEDVSVKMKENTFDQVYLEVEGETLFITPRRKGQARVAVFITISDLKRLVLAGDAFAASRGKLAMPAIEVSILENGRLQLGSKGRVTVDTPDNYSVLRQSDYVLAQGISKS